MSLVRHRKLASDIKEIAMHYAGVSERVLDGFWAELDTVILSIERNPRIHHFDTSGLRRANFRKYPYHLLYHVENDDILLLTLRHDRRDPSFGLDRR